MAGRAFAVALDVPQTSIPRPAPGSPRLERLVIAASSLITEVSLEGVLQRVVEIGAEVIGARYAAIGVLACFNRIDLFFAFILVPMNLALIALWFWQRQADRKFLAGAGMG